MVSKHLDRPGLWRASVPVFDGMLGRLAGELAEAERQLGDAMAAALAQRPAAGMMAAAQ